MPSALQERDQPASMPGPILDLTAHFRGFREADPERLHFAAHSHNLWPDVTRAAQAAVWDDAARLVDEKWGHILGTVWPEVAAGLARHLRLPDPATLVPAPNTHELLNRLLSALPADRPARILATDAEFHSFGRQMARLEEDGLVAVTRVAAEPFATLADRLAQAARGAFDMAFVSHVLFTSGYALPDLDGLVGALTAPGRLVVIDGYHGFLAGPTDLSRVADKAFYLAGGYKYAMAGEGACFLHCPPGVAPRPRNTGWYAAFGTLTGRQEGVPYAGDGWRFMGATFDASGLYRQRAVLGWLDGLGLEAGAIRAHAHALQARFVAGMRERPVGPLAPDRLVVPLEEPSRGNFLTFRDPDAAGWSERLKAANIVTDARGDRLRVGFGLYHTAGDVDRLVQRLRTLG